MSECKKISIEQGIRVAQKSHYHDYAEFIIVDDGALKLTLETPFTAGITAGMSDVSEQVLHTGDIAVVFPNIKHECSPGGVYKCDNNCAGCKFVGGSCCDENHWCSMPKVEYCSYTSLCVETDLLGDFTERLALYRPRSPFILNGDVHADITYCINALTEYGSTTNSDLIRGYLIVMMSRVFEKVDLVYVETGVTSSIMREVVAYLEEYYCDKLTLSNVARKIGVNKYSLSRRFEAEFGCNFNTLLNSIRIDHAKRMLVSTEKSIQDIMYSSGFESECTFYRVFKSVNSVTPKQFRKIYRRAATA